MRVTVRVDGEVVQVDNPEYIVAMLKIWGRDGVATARFRDGRERMFRLYQYKFGNQCPMEVKHEIQRG